MEDLGWVLEMLVLIGGFDGVVIVVNRYVVYLG